MTDATDRFALPHILPGQAQKEIFHNEALALIDGLLCPAVESRGDTVTPASPEPGQAWIAGTGPSGDWSGKSDHLAIWTSGGWRFAAPQEGMQVWLRDTNMHTRYDGAGWIDGEVTGNTLKLGGVQLVGAQEPAIADVAGGTTIDGEARVAIASILGALRNHGLIAS